MVLPATNQHCGTASICIFDVLMTYLSEKKQQNPDGCYGA